jgi:hypothetical protein
MAPMTELRPCPGCERHVRRDEEACPFCRRKMASGEGGPPRRWPAGRLGRAAIMAFGVAAATGGTALAPACGDDGSPPGDSGTSDSGRSDSGTNDSGTNDSGTDDAGFDSGMAMPYGAPPEEVILV